MPIGFGMRIMPGVRISASSRGIRTGIGPRAARLHVGSGGIGASTGVGPFTAYTGTGRRRRRSSLGSSLQAYERELRRAQREQEIAEVAKKERQLVSVHLEEFPPAQPQRAPSPAPVDRRAVLKDFRRQALSDIPWYKRSERRTAKQVAAQQAESAIEAEEQRRADAQAEEQARLDTSWRQLTNNDPQTVIAALEEAFEDNQAPAAPINCEGDEVTVMMLYESPDLVPDRKPALTPSGNLTLHKRNKTERNQLYIGSLASNVLATVKEAFAVALGINKVTVMVVRKDDTPQLARPILSCLYCGRFERSRFEQLEWSGIDPLVEISGTPGALIERKGRTAEIVPLDISDDPDLATVLRSAAEALGCEANFGSISVRRQSEARATTPTRESSQDKFTPRSKQGKKDQRNYTLLLERYEENLALLEQLITIRAQYEGHAGVEQRFTEVRNNIYSNLERPDGIFEKLDILEGRNTGMDEKRKKRAELQARQASIESQLPPR